MKPSNPSGPENSRRDLTDFEQQVKAKSRRKAQARREGDRSIWSGLGLFGMVG